ncbi:piggyBac transposable element-derived protein 4 [Trichonephila clavipes]|nr:piggyBac transposable element-derived protein 4 [Trichonephila clavipes]
MNFGTLVTNDMERVGNAPLLEVVCAEELLNIIFSKKRVARPVLALTIATRLHLNRSVSLQQRYLTVFTIQHWLATDVDSKFLLNGIPYLGKDEERSENLSLSENVVLRSIEPFENKGRNISKHNLFTTVNLCQILQTKSTALTGTMKRNQKEVPEFVKNVKMPLYDTLLLEHGRITLTVYHGKTSKNVLLLSYLHPTVHIDNND